MQRVTNCIVIDQDHILLLKKPSRGWYAIPGGKMEQGETIKESAIREYWEETALTPNNPTLAGVFTFSIYHQEELENEWMMFTFITDSYQGQLTEHCDEGELEWVPIKQLHQLPMAEGDHKIFEHILTSKATVFGAFSYTNEFQLIDYRIN
ncbi:NUDIX domain-containing protein [Ornithinibacillus sp. L9]|uniref:NUDIX domain-containing protein n=1 Tax=Ornithinibacillus caprae TaxID=2678566 RepID=A0A6N8FM81_9BACI|nr:8-oxo-dGTP diphosphatase [Ornithinibacillus caprae]MUK89107.1 NUDIX domain-containing protein [Ornithinibacillus caprae]